MPPKKKPAAAAASSSSAFESDAADGLGHEIEMNDKLTGNMNELLKEKMLAKMTYVDASKCTYHSDNCRETRLAGTAKLRTKFETEGYTYSIGMIYVVEMTREEAKKHFPADFDADGNNIKRETPWSDTDVWQKQVFDASQWASTPAAAAEREEHRKRVEEKYWFVVDGMHRTRAAIEIGKKVIALSKSELPADRARLEKMAMKSPIISANVLKPLASTEALSLSSYFNDLTGTVVAQTLFDKLTFMRRLIKHVQRDLEAQGKPRIDLEALSRKQLIRLVADVSKKDGVAASDAANPSDAADSAIAEDKLSSYHVLNIYKICVLYGSKYVNKQGRLVSEVWEIFREDTGREEPILTMSALRLCFTTTKCKPSTGWIKGTSAHVLRRIKEKSHAASSGADYDCFSSSKPDPCVNMAVANYRQKFLWEQALKLFDQELQAAFGSEVRTEVENTMINDVFKLFSCSRSWSNVAQEFMECLDAAKKNPARGSGELTVSLARLIGSQLTKLRNVRLKPKQDELAAAEKKKKQAEALQLQLAIAEKKKQEEAAAAQAKQKEAADLQAAEAQHASTASSSADDGSAAQAAPVVEASADKPASLATLPDAQETKEALEDAHLTSDFHGGFVSDHEDDVHSPPGTPTPDARAKVVSSTAASPAHSFASDSSRVEEVALAHASRTAEVRTAEHMEKIKFLVGDVHLHITASGETSAELKDKMEQVAGDNKPYLVWMDPPWNVVAGERWDRISDENLITSICNAANLLHQHGTLVVALSWQQLADVMTHSQLHADFDCERSPLVVVYAPVCARKPNGRTKKMSHASFPLFILSRKGSNPTRNVDVTLYPDLQGTPCFSLHQPYCNVVSNYKPDDASLQLTWPAKNSPEHLLAVAASSTNDELYRFFFPDDNAIGDWQQLISKCIKVQQCIDPDDGASKAKRSQATKKQKQQILAQLPNLVEKLRAAEEEAQQSLDAALQGDEALPMLPEKGKGKTAATSAASATPSADGAVAASAAPSKGKKKEAPGSGKPSLLRKGAKSVALMQLIIARYLPRDQTSSHLVLDLYSGTTPLALACARRVDPIPYIAIDRDPYVTYLAQQRVEGFLIKYHKSLLKSTVNTEHVLQSGLYHKALKEDSATLGRVLARPYDAQRTFAELVAYHPDPHSVSCENCGRPKFEFEVEGENREPTWTLLAGMTRSERCCRSTCEAQVVVIKKDADAQRKLKAAKQSEAGPAAAASPPLRTPPWNRSNPLHAIRDPNAELDAVLTATDLVESLQSEIEASSVCIKVEHPDFEWADMAVDKLSEIVIQASEQQSVGDMLCCFSGAIMNWTDQQEQTGPIPAAVESDPVPMELDEEKSSAAQAVATAQAALLVKQTECAQEALKLQSTQLRKRDPFHAATDITPVLHLKDAMKKELGDRTRLLLIPPKKSVAAFIYAQSHRDLASPANVVLMPHPYLALSAIGPLQYAQKQWLVPGSFVLVAKTTIAAGDKLIVELKTGDEMKTCHASSDPISNLAHYVQPIIMPSELLEVARHQLQDAKILGHHPKGTRTAKQLAHLAEAKVAEEAEFVFRYPGDIDMSSLDVAMGADDDDAYGAEAKTAAALAPEHPPRATASHAQAEAVLAELRKEQWQAIDPDFMQQAAEGEAGQAQRGRVTRSVKGVPGYCKWYRAKAHKEPVVKIDGTLQIPPCFAAPSESDSVAAAASAAAPASVQPSPDDSAIIELIERFNSAAREKDVGLEDDSLVLASEKYSHHSDLFNAATLRADWFSSVLAQHNSVQSIAGTHYPINSQLQALYDGFSVDFVSKTHVSRIWNVVPAIEGSDKLTSAARDLIKFPIGKFLTADLSSSQYPASPECAQAWHEAIVAILGSKEFLALAEEISAVNSLPSWVIVFDLACLALSLVDFEATDGTVSLTADSCNATLESALPHTDAEKQARGRFASSSLPSPPPFTELRTIKRFVQQQCEPDDFPFAQQLATQHHLSQCNLYLFVAQPLPDELSGLAENEEQRQALCTLINNFNTKLNDTRLSILMAPEDGFPQNLDVWDLNATWEKPLVKASTLSSNFEGIVAALQANDLSKLNSSDRKLATYIAAIQKLRQQLRDAHKSLQAEEVAAKATTRNLKKRKSADEAGSATSTPGSSRKKRKGLSTADDHEPEDDEGHRSSDEESVVVHERACLACNQNVTSAYYQGCKLHNDAVFCAKSCFDDHFQKVAHAPGKHAYRLKAQPAVSRKRSQAAQQESNAQAGPSSKARRLDLITGADASSAANAALSGSQE